MFFHQPDGIGGLHRLMEAHMAKSLLNHFDRGEGVMLHLEQRDLQFFGPVEQLGERISRPRGDLLYALRMF